MKKRMKKSVGTAAKVVRRNDDKAKNSSRTATRYADQDLVPVTWAEILRMEFGGSSFPMARTSGRHLICINQVCKQLGLDFGEQWASLVADPGFVTREIGTPNPLGGNILVLRMIAVEQLSDWLAGIDTSRMEAESGRRFLEYRAVFTDAVSRFCASATTSGDGASNTMLESIIGRLHEEITAMQVQLQEMEDMASDVRLLYSDIRKSEDFLRDMEAAGIVMNVEPPGGSTSGAGTSENAGAGESQQGN